MQADGATQNRYQLQYPPARKTNMQANTAKQNKYLSPSTLPTRSTSMQADGGTQDKYAIEVHAGTQNKYAIVRTF